jgi:hypothetical protein
MFYPLVANSCLGFFHFRLNHYKTKGIRRMAKVLGKEFTHRYQPAVHSCLQP